MKVFEWNQIELQNFSQTDFFAKGTGLSVGSFDGLHLGHRFLLNELIARCSEQGIAPGLITFSRPLPAYKHSDDYTGDISTINQRLSIFEELGIEFVFIVDFTQDFSSLKGVDFLNILHQSLNMKFIAEGIDFRCGYKGSTDTQAIKYWAAQNNVAFSFVDPVYYTEADGNEERVSSSYIRKMIQKGFFNTAKELLARSYQIDIDQIREQGRSTQIFPPDGFYSCTSETGSSVRVQIQNHQLVTIPECKSITILL